MLTNQPLKSTPPPLPYLSSSRPPIADLFPQSSNSYLTQDNPTVEVTGADATDSLGNRPLPPLPTERPDPLIWKSSNPFMSADELKLNSEWDETFEEFAAGRLQSPEDLAMECRTQQNAAGDHQLEHDRNKGELPPAPDANEQTNLDGPIYNQPVGRFLSDALSSPGQMKNNNTLHFDTFPQFLETIPEQRSFDSDDSTLNTPTNSPEPCDFNTTEQDNNTTNDFTHTNINTAPFNISSAQLNNNNSSPGFSSSGLGSSTEEDGFSYFSSQSEKFSVLSSEEAENVPLDLKNSSDLAVVKNAITPESGDSIADKFDDPSLLEGAHQTVSEFEGIHSEKIGWSFLDDSFQTLSAMTSERETKHEYGENETLNTLNVNPDLLKALQPTSVVSQQSNDEGKEESKDCTVDASEDFNACSKNSAAEEGIPGSPDDEFPSMIPSLHITTSSPEVKQDLLDMSNEKSSLEQQEAPVEHGIFDDSFNVSRIVSSPSQDFDTNWLHVQTSDQSSNSFLQSLSVSTDSQDYLTCDSHPFSKESSISTLYSANSTLCGEMSDVQAGPGDLLGMDHTNVSQSSNFEINQSEIFGESLHGDQGNLVNLETSLTVGDGLQVPPTSLPDMSFIPEIHSEVGKGNQDNIFLKSSEGQHIPLQRSHSEGMLTPAFDQLRLSSFGSDPCAIQESSFPQLRPDLPFPNLFAPSLTPESSSSHVALPALSPLAAASVTAPPGPEHIAAPEPDVTEQLQATNQPSR